MQTPHLPGHQIRSPGALAILLPVLVAALVYLNGLGNGFVYDDHFVVVQNEHILTLGLSKIFGHEYWAGFKREGTGTYYRPLTILSFALDRAAWGLDPTGYHLTNLALHALCTALVYLLGLRLFRARTAALCAALLFAAHPVHTESVANISGRSDLLFATLSLVALNLYLRPAGPPRWGIPVAVFFALCAKESALVLPLVFIACDAIQKPANVPALPHLRARIRGHHLPIWLAVAAFIALRTLAVGNLRPVPPSPLDNPLVQAGLTERLLTLPVLALHYLRLLLFPATLSADYGCNQIPVVTAPVHPLLLPGLLVLGLGASAFVRCWKRSREAALGAALLALPLLPNLNPILPAGTMLAERYLYLPSAGFCLLAGLLAGRLWSAHSARRSLYAALGILVLAACAGRTVLRNRDWRSDEALFRSAVQASPNSVRAHLNLAFLLRRRGDLKGAIARYRQVLAIKGDYPVVHHNLAEAYKVLGDTPRALHHYEQTVRLKPGFVDAWTALGNLYLEQGQEVEAEAAFKMALNLAPRLAFVYNQLGVIYQRRGDYRAARTAYEKAIAGNYRRPGVYCNLGVAYAREGRADAALEAYLQALALQPDLAIAHFHLGNLYREQGDSPSALEHYRAFLKYWKDDPRYIELVRRNIRALGST